MKRIFIYRDEKSAKFWTIDIGSTSFSINFGKLNTEGQNQTKTFDDATECKKQADKLIKEKLKKGYVEQSENSQSTDSTSINNAKIPNSKNSTTFKILMEGDDAQPACFIVDITDPDSISAVLNYQIDNFDEFKDHVQEYDHEYGYLDSNSEYVCFDDDHSSSEEIFLKAAVEFKQLHPTLKKYVDKIIEANLDGQLLYSNQDTILGLEAVSLLAMNDKKYVKLFEEFIYYNQAKFSSRDGAILEEYNSAVMAKWQKKDDRSEKLLKKYFMSKIDYGEFTTSYHKLTYLYFLVEDDIPVMDAVIKYTLEKNKYATTLRNDLICKAYSLMDNPKLPLKLVENYIDDLYQKKSTSISAYNPQDYAFERIEVKPFHKTDKVNFSKPEELKAFLDNIVEHFDEYERGLRLIGSGFDIHLTDLSTKNSYHNTEGDFFLAVSHYKQELEQPTYQYIKLLIEAYQKRGLFYSVSWRKNKEYYGTSAAGALACFGEQYEDDILTFLDLILTYDNDDSNKKTILNRFRYIIGKTKPEAKLPKIKEKYGIKNW